MLEFLPLFSKEPLPTQLYYSFYSVFPLYFKFVEHILLYFVGARPLKYKNQQLSFNLLIHDSLADNLLREYASNIAVFAHFVYC